MIFDDNYDKSLWLIINNDKKNRDRIVEFIKSIPNDFILMIQNTLIEYNNYKLGNDDISFSNREYKKFNCEMRYGLEHFSFNIDVKNDFLCIGKSIYRPATYYPDFQLQLLSYDSKGVMQDLGGISFDFDNCISFNYKVIPTFFGNVVISINNRNEFKLCGIDNDGVFAKCKERKLKKR